MGDDDIALDEKRMFGDKREVSVAYVAAGMGVATVEVSGDQIGRFHLEERCTPSDVAARDGRLVVATDEDVLVATEEGFAPAGFGPAVAVGVGDGLLAAGPDGAVARRDGDGWHPVGTVADVRAIDGDLLATAGGVYRVIEDDLTHAGLDDAADVTARGLPLAATDHGLYYLGNGWMDAHDGAFAAVASDGDRAHAVTADGRLYERGDGSDDWTARTVPAETPLVDVAYGECPYAVTADGTFLVDAEPDTTPDGGGGWRTRSLGLQDVVGVAVP